MDEVKQPLDTTIEGGAYVKDGVVVDANGAPRVGWTVDTNGNAVAPGAAPATPAPKGKSAPPVDPNAPKG